MIKLFIGGFPLEITELELVQLVSPHGTVETIKIVRDRKTGVCKGYAFLEMKSMADAENAVAMLHKTKVGERELTLNIVQEEVAVAVAAPAHVKAVQKPKRPRIAAK